HQEYSLSGGSVFTGIAVPGGPLDAPIACCDPDVVHDKRTGTTFSSLLYTNAAQTNGVVTIWVRRAVNALPVCSYTIDPAGTANNILPDYPHLGLSNKFLYLTTNNIVSGTTWGGAQVRRFNLDQMVDCLTTSFTTYTYTGVVGQRVFVPVEGAKDVMYWGSMETGTSFRLFKWAESAAAPLQYLRTVAASTFANPDCRGGTNNRDWIERTTAWMITGFRMRGAVGYGSSGAGRISFYWNVGPDASHLQGHVHSVVISETSLGVLAQPHIWNATACFGYPAVASNERGDLGLSIGYGGKAGGGTTVPAVQGYVGIDDDYTPGVGFFGTVYLTASGNRNPADKRFGDYFTVRPYSPCDLAFVATNYALLNGTTTAYVNARYVEFVRGQNRKCYFGWNTKTRTP
ncbi:MAG: hypothetical protein AAB225_09710, partial [Acidobacteriota bacterium]